jgi:LytS/YehU family sensor histidine kinase
MHKDVEAADRMIMRLSDLLRAALDSADTQEVTLRKELELLQLYLGIEQIRFGERLTVKLDVAPEALEAQVPNFILQPLVENAIRHGIEPRARPGRIELNARRQADFLSLEVCDNGKGIQTAKPAREGVGLSNTRARLRELYGEAHRFELGPQPDGGLRVAMTIPYHTEIGPDENSNSNRR